MYEYTIVIDEIHKIYPNLSLSFSIPIIIQLTKRISAKARNTKYISFFQKKKKMKDRNELFKRDPHERSIREEENARSIHVAWNNNNNNNCEGL